RKFEFAPHVNHGDGPKRIELIGPVNAPGGDGPSNGMYALQKELRRRIAEGLDWLTIKPLPASRDAIPWFWNWHDRSYACWWNSQGLPFIQGPNMLFTNSRSPRIDAEECALLDAKHCVAMFCHSEWYRDLIAANRGPENQSPIYMWPYPIDPLPGPPLPAEYDLLIYAKNGHRPGLLEHLAELYPRHIQIHYGQYRRDQLYEAARRSRACAYLADDDHGPLALAEILLAGCPVVGVRTGAPFIEHGVTGYFVERLPPGALCVECRDHFTALEAFVKAIKQAVTANRLSVQAKTSKKFETTDIVDRLLRPFASLSDDFG
ncbi:MAG: glycosyltransferase, partial [Planctomycetales bacterium]|nr:glycosyltransferase [Planctomycetales bacterium]